jgi:hypothetical protein
MPSTAAAATATTSGGGRNVRRVGLGNALMKGTATPAGG